MCMSGARVRTYTDFVLTACNNLRWYNILGKLNSTAASVITDVASHIVGHFIRLLHSWWSIAHHRAVDQLEEPNWMRSQCVAEGTSNHLATFHNCSLWAPLQMHVYNTSPGFIKTLSAESGLEFGFGMNRSPFSIAALRPRPTRFMPLYLLRIWFQDGPRWCAASVALQDESPGLLLSAGQ